MGNGEAHLVRDVSVRCEAESKEGAGSVEKALKIADTARRRAR
jgi:hypothetical protein